MNPPGAPPSGPPPSGTGFRLPGLKIAEKGACAQRIIDDRAEWVNASNFRLSARGELW